MATVTTLSRAQVSRIPLQIQWSEVQRINKSAVVSGLLALLFVLYFMLPHSGIIGTMLGFRLSVLYVFIAPLAALIFSVMSMRQIIRTHDHGLILSTIALVVTSLYFIVALAIPFVLLGCYVVYAYLLQ